MNQKREVLHINEADVIEHKGNPALVIGLVDKEKKTFAFALVGFGTFLSEVGCFVVSRLPGQQVLVERFSTSAGPDGVRLLWPSNQKVCPIHAHFPRCSLEGDTTQSIIDELFDQEIEDHE